MASRSIGHHRVHGTRQLRTSIGQGEQHLPHRLRSGLHRPIPAFIRIHRGRGDNIRLDQVYDQPPLERQVADGYLTPLSINYSVAKNNATALVSATSLEVTATGTGQNYGLNTMADSGNITGGGPPYLNVRVAPGTGILLSGTADVSVSGICNADPHTTICGVNARLHMLIGGSGTNMYISGSSPGYQGPVGSVYTNFSNSFQDVSVNIWGGVQVYSSSYVPEPSTYALLMAGSLMAAGIARRRNLRP